MAEEHVANILRVDPTKPQGLSDVLGDFDFDSAAKEVLYGSGVALSVAADTEVEKGLYVFLLGVLEEEGK